ncbi:MAG: hypothetical protein M9894_07350 [Planctomycetes bacterium]|nr:hypothetical protein [Planctomycetota bacterium]
MPRSPRRGGPGLAAALTVLVLAPSAGAFEAPDDAALLPNLAFRVHEEVEAGELVAMWARRFGALAVVDPALRPVRVRFVTPVEALTWRATKLLLEFHEVLVVESQPIPGSPWLIRAHHRNAAPSREPGPFRLVEGELAPATGEVVTAVFPIKHGAAQAILNAVMRVWQRDPGARMGTMFHVPGPELIIVVDQASKVRYYGQLIESLDVAGPRRELVVHPLLHAPAEQLAPLVMQALTTLSPQVPGQAPAAFSVPPQVLADPRTNQIIIASSPADLPAVRRLVDELDVRVGAPRGRFHIYRCRDMEADYLAEKLRDLLAAEGGGQGPTGAAPAGGVSEVPTRIVADPRKNSLLIQAEEPAYRDVLRLLAELDQRPMRVLIEAEVWEVSTPTDQLSIGVELAALTNAHDGSTRPAGATAFGLSTLQPQQDAQGNITSLGRVPNVGAGLTAVLTRDTFNRIPLILNMIANFEESRLVTKSFAATNDNESASFTVSLATPYVRVNTSNVAVQQDVAYVDASSTLKIKPQVNSADYLTLELELQISSFSGSGSPTLPPGTSTRSYAGKVTVPNERYVAFGGLEQETERTAEDKVPFVGDIPVLGHLFKNWSRSRTRTRVYIFIRPTIFAEDSFGPDGRLGEHLRARAHAAAKREAWLPPVVPERVRHAGFDLQDEAFERFGRGSGDPFGAGRPD